MSSRAGDLEKRLHPIGGFALQRGQDVAVGVDRQADLAVTQCLHHDSWVDPLDEQQGRAGMP